MMLNLADRIDICAVHNEDNKAVLEHIAACAGTTFDPRNVRAFIAADAKYHILEHVRDGSYESTVRDYYDNHIYRDEMLESLIMMLSMTIDFKNEDTLSHSIQTAQIAKTLGQCCGIRGEGLEDLYYAGLLHDIGKIKLPDGMLDKDAMLVGEEAEVFRKHPARPSSATECL